MDETQKPETSADERGLELMEKLLQELHQMNRWLEKISERLGGFTGM